MAITTGFKDWTSVRKAVEILVRSTAAYQAEVAWWSTTTLARLTANLEPGPVHRFPWSPDRRWVGSARLAAGGANRFLQRRASGPSREIRVERRPDLKVLVSGLEPGSALNVDGVLSEVRPYLAALERQVAPEHRVSLSPGKLHLRVRSILSADLKRDVNRVRSCIDVALGDPDRWGAEERRLEERANKARQARIERFLATQLRRAIGDGLEETVLLEAFHQGVVDAVHAD